MTDAIVTDEAASLRAQNTRLSAAYLEIADTLRAVYAYLPECPPHVAARLRQILAGLDLACKECAARRVEERRAAEVLTGLAELQRVEVGE